MQLTRAADYGVRAMVHLAGLPPGSRANGAELARAADVSEAFLTKVLQRLTSAGVIVSHRGSNGGFELSGPPSAISLLQVVEAVEGPIQLNLCTGVCNGNGPTCERKDWCAVHVVWAHAQAKLRAILGEASLEMLASESSRRLTTIRGAR